MIKLMAFDWNGTLFADVETLRLSVNKILRHFKSGKINRRRFQEVFDQPMFVMYGHLGFKKDFIVKRQKLIDKIFTQNYEPLADKCRSRTGAKEVLKYLSKNNIRSIIYSNHTTQAIARQLKRLGMAKFIQTVIAREPGDISHYHTRSKDQKLFDYVKRNKLKPKEVLTVGDTEEEIEIGKKFGYHTVAITGGYNTTTRLKKHYPDFLIHNMLELKKIIQKLNKA